jgi:uncharacterized membrane protein
MFTVIIAYMLLYQSIGNRKQKKKLLNQQQAFLQFIIIFRSSHLCFILLFSIVFTKYLFQNMCKQLIKYLC